MRNFLLLAALVLVAACSRGGAKAVSLDFAVPEGWSTPRKDRSGGTAYALYAKEGGGVLTFSKWTGPGQAADIPRLEQTLSGEFLKRVQESDVLALRDEQYERGQIAGGHCQGQFVIFHMKTGESTNLTSVFMFSVDGQLWHGSFSGSAAQWAQALKVLGELKYKG